MSWTLNAIFSFSILLAAIIGIIRFKNISPNYYPFIFSLWIGSLNEIVSYFLIRNSVSNALNGNIYVLIESLLISWQFKKWDAFKNNRWVFEIIIILFVTSWIIENFFISRITSFSSYFRVLYSFIIVLISVNTINELIIRERRNIMKNSVFLICTAFIIYYTYKVLVETFWIYGLNYSRGFRNNVYIILTYINLFANLIYGLAVLWMPTKQRFTLPS